MPKRPLKEPPNITIGNLERENRNLVARIVDLVKSRDENYESAKQWREQACSAQKERDGLLKVNDQLARHCNYSDGYIARVKETDPR